MYDMITKKEFMKWYGEGFIDDKNHSLKGIQDGFILANLLKSSNLKIAEIGGGHSRVLEKIKSKNECWNIDKFEGTGNGPITTPKEDKKIRIVKSYMGEFDQNIPSNYFDVVFSISVIEHIDDTNLMNFFKDCYRILKPGGTMLHAIDHFMFDRPNIYWNNRVNTIKNYAEDTRFVWINEPKIDSTLTFKCRYATNSDLTCALWNQITDKEFKEHNEIGQIGSIKLVVKKL